MESPGRVMRSVTRGVDAPRSIAKGTVPRIWRFAAPSGRPGRLPAVHRRLGRRRCGHPDPRRSGRGHDRRGRGVPVAAATIVRLALAIAGARRRRRGHRARRRAGCPRGIGEGLIADLRRAVYAHVQRMPVAFFTRTRTGALVSRLNNDVHRRAVGDHLDAGQRGRPTSSSSSLALAVMITLAWQVTVLALVLLPIFVIPARRHGRRDRRPAPRVAPTSTPAMTNQMTERFSAPGATLVKLFGRPTPRSPSSATAPPGSATSGCAPRWCRGCSSPRCRWCRRWPRRWSTASAAGSRSPAGSRRARSSPWRCCSPGSTRR